MKSERVKAHLKNCQAFNKTFPPGHTSRPTFMEEPNFKKAKLSLFSPVSSTSKMSQRTLEGSVFPKLKQKEQTGLDKALAMWFYMTGTSFSRIEQSHLLKAFRIARPGVTLPNRKTLAGPLLDLCFNSLQKKVCTYFF
jgi:hypothetical protein